MRCAHRFASEKRRISLPEAIRNRPCNFHGLRANFVEWWLRLPSRDFWRTRFQSPQPKPEARQQYLTCPRDATVLQRVRETRRFASFSILQRVFETREFAPFLATCLRDARTCTFPLLIFRRVRETREFATCPRDARDCTLSFTFSLTSHHLRHHAFQREHDNPGEAAPGRVGLRELAEAHPQAATSVRPLGVRRRG